MKQAIPTEASFKKDLAFLSNMYLAPIQMSLYLVPDRVQYYNQFFQIYVLCFEV